MFISIEQERNVGFYSCFPIAMQATVAQTECTCLEISPWLKNLYPAFKVIKEVHIQTKNKGDHLLLPIRLSSYHKQPTNKQVQEAWDENLKNVHSAPSRNTPDLFYTKQQHNNTKHHHKKNYEQPKKESSLCCAVVRWWGIVKRARCYRRAVRLRNYLVVVTSYSSEEAKKKKGKSRSEINWFFSKTTTSSWLSVVLCCDRCWSDSELCERSSRKSVEKWR